MNKKLCKPLAFILCLAAGGLSLVAWGAAEPAKAPAFDNPFRKNVKVEVIDDLIVVHSDGIPDHATGPFPNRHNPNTIRRQDYTFKIPLHPQWSDHITRTPMGPIGVAINGIPFYNPYNAQGQDAAKNEVFDECCGHPDPAGRYHYHIYPKCVHTSFKDEPGKHSGLIGYAFDGYAIYGPNGEDGKPPTDLDECNGHTDSARGYHYHVTNKFPYIIGGYHGVVERSNFDGRQRDMAMMNALAAPDDGGPGNGSGGGNGPGPGNGPPGGPGGGNGPRGQNGPPAGYHLLPRFAMENLNLTDEERTKLADLEAEVKTKLKAILTADQYKQLEQMTPPGPRRQGRGQPGGGGPGGGGPGGGGQQGGGGGPQGGNGPPDDGGPQGNGRPPRRGRPPGGGQGDPNQ